MSPQISQDRIDKIIYILFRIIWGISIVQYHIYTIIWIHVLSREDPIYKIYDNYYVTVKSTLLFSPLIFLGIMMLAQMLRKCIYNEITTQEIVLFPLSAHRYTSCVVLLPILASYYYVDKEHMIYSWVIHTFSVSTQIYIYTSLIPLIIMCGCMVLQVMRTPTNPYVIQV